MSFYYIFAKIGDLFKPLYNKYMAISQNFSLLCYSLGWISGLIILHRQNYNFALRFHAWQSIITGATMSIALIIPLVAIKFITITSFALAWSLLILYWLIVGLAVYLWILLMYKAGQGGMYKLFIAGDMAWKLSIAGTYTKDKLPYALKGATPPLLEYPDLKSQESEASPGIWQEVVNSIAALYKNRDPYTALHQERVAQLACAIAGEMNLQKDRIEGIHIMGVIHDIGKIAVPGEILSKSGKLNDYELAIIRTHPEVAFSILKGLQFPWPVARAILQHHERLDGSGYPGGISGDEILMETRILSVSDVVEAMATHRPYRPALGIKEALHEITCKKGTLYDPDVVDACTGLFTRKGFAWDEDGTKIAMNVPVELSV